MATVVPLTTMTPVELLGSLTDVERKHAPHALFLAGDVSLLQRGLRIAVVGTRHGTRAGRQRATVLSRALVERGVTIVSGLASGIDTAAHAAAIGAGGRTVAVLGTPLSEAHPRDNAGLQATIAAQHLLVSQFPPGAPRTARHFPIRNRTMALLSDATVIVEAGERSGTLYQGWEALRLGRPLLLLESVAVSTGLVWPQEMLAHGAAVLTRSNLDEALAGIPPLAARLTGSLDRFV